MSAQSLQPIHPAGEAIRRLSRQMQESQFGIGGAFNQTRPVSDPQSQTSASLHSFDRTARIVFGVITDCTAIGYAYRVQVEKAKQPVVAISLTHTSLAVFGPKEINTLQPGTQVACIIHEQSPYAMIIGVIPPFGSSAKFNHHGIIHGASRGRVDAAHKRPLQMSLNGGIPAAVSGRPFDATNVGEVGWITETGMRIFLDSFMAIMGLDESCQLSFFHHDQLARLAAYQWQLWTSCREEESLNDQDETQDWIGYAMYPWENLGLAARADPTTIKTPQEWQRDTPWYSKMEPLDDFMMPWHRSRVFHGYLGQGGKQCLITPPLEFKDDGNKGTDGQTDAGAGTRTQHVSFAGGKGLIGAACPGVYDNSVYADGRWVVQSAKGISLIKRPVIITPTRLRRPEEPAGDNPENYKASGVLGQGPEHKITGDLETNGDHPQFNRALGIMDFHAYACNYAGVHPFFYHAKDYKLHDEADATWAGGQSAAIPNFGKLAAEMFLSPKDFEHRWKVDHRYKEQTFHTLSSSINMLDDGGIVINDGYGASIRMSGGSIEISAPGDIWFKSGRNVNAWAGRDLIMRAKQSWDLTATDGDGRVKAEHNLMMLSGNSGSGGTLIESRGGGPAFDFEKPGEQAQFGGVVIRSPESPVVAWSNQIYLRTGGSGIAAGPIVLDAGRGTGALMTYAIAEQHYLQQGTFWHFNTVNETVDGPSALISASATVLPSSLFVKGDSIVDGSVIINGGLAVTGAIASTSCPMIACLEGDALGAVLEQVNEGQQTVTQQIPQDVGQAFMDAVSPQLYTANRPGDDTVIRTCEFGFREQTDYRTEQFHLFEDHWQQLARTAGITYAEWTENPVLQQGRETYPYPGAESFQGTTFHQQDFTIFDAQNQRSHSRGDAPELNDRYAEPKFATVGATTLNAYPVIP